ncbi:MAG: hypothetical protein V7641_835 [Blastocatellia bacterium]
MNHDAPPVSQQEKPPLPLAVRVSVLIGIIVGGLYLASFLADKKTLQPESQSATPHTSQQSNSATPKRTKSVGDEVKIYVEGLKTITVAVDEDAYSELDKVFQAKDQYGYDHLLAEGRIFRVTNNTRALILENGFFKLKVRILEGIKQGYAGLVPREWLQ